MVLIRTILRSFPNINSNYKNVPRRLLILGIDQNGRDHDESFFCDARLKGVGWLQKSNHSHNGIGAIVLGFGRAQDIPCFREFAILTEYSKLYQIVMLMH